MILPPQTVQILPSGNWGHKVADGPIWVYIEAAISGGGSEFTNPTYSILDAAVAYLATMLPPVRMIRSVMVDSLGNVLFGYAWEPQNERPNWYGCEAGFLAMGEAGVDPLDLMLWEANAREHTDIKDWWKQ